MVGKLGLAVAVHVGQPEGPQLFASLAYISRAPPTDQVQVLDAPARGEAVQCHHPAVCGRHAAHERLGQLERRRIDDRFDLVPLHGRDSVFEDRRRFGPSRQPLKPVLIRSHVPFHTRPVDESLLR